jgi:hypothetical protein
LVTIIWIVIPLALSRRRAMISSHSSHLKDDAQSPVARGGTSSNDLGGAARMSSRLLTASVVIRVVTATLLAGMIVTGLALSLRGAP